MSENEPRAWVDLCCEPVPNKAPQAGIGKIPSNLLQRAYEQALGQRRKKSVVQQCNGELLNGFRLPARFQFAMIALFPGRRRVASATCSHERTKSASNPSSMSANLKGGSPPFMAFSLNRSP